MTPIDLIPTQPHSLLCFSTNVLIRCPPPYRDFLDARGHCPYNSRPYERYWFYILFFLNRKVNNFKSSEWLHKARDELKKSKSITKLVTNSCTYLQRCGVVWSWECQIMCAVGDCCLGKLDVNGTFFYRQLFLLNDVSERRCGYKE